MLLCIFFISNHHANAQLVFLLQVLIARQQEKAIKASVEHQLALEQEQHASSKSNVAARKPSSGAATASITLAPSAAHLAAPASNKLACLSIALPVAFPCSSSH